MATRTCSRRSFGSSISAGVMSPTAPALRRIVRYELVESSSRYIQNETVRSREFISGMCGTFMTADAPSNHAPAPVGPWPGPALGAVSAWLPCPLESAARSLSKS